ncbi:hypothetical protein BHM03_00033103, partial [Ensete ventricosum]
SVAIFGQILKLRIVFPLSSNFIRLKNCLLLKYPFGFLVLFAWNDGSLFLFLVSTITLNLTHIRFVCRYSDPINTPRGRNEAHDFQRREHTAEDIQLFSCSPVLEHPNGGNAYSHGRTFTDTIFSRRTASPSPGLRGHTFSTSPVHPSSFGIGPASPNCWQDNLRSPPHPLPLPPGSPSCSSASPSSSSSRSPKSLWKKGKLLGRGTFGQVYVGFNRYLVYYNIPSHFQIGFDCLESELTFNCHFEYYKSSNHELIGYLFSFHQEIALLSKLSHPNIVQYYGSELAEDTLSVYLEYVSGGSIYKLLQEYGPFGESLIRNYTAQILSGLAYLHGRNTVHRYMATNLCGGNTFCFCCCSDGMRWIITWQGY